MTSPSESEGRALREPFPWMSRTSPAGRYKFTLRSPESEAITGSFMALVGIVFLVFLLADPSAPRIALGVLLFGVFAGLGALLLVMAVARARWIRAYRRMHGHVPPY